jgi:hypothetical protein
MNAAPKFYRYLIFPKNLKIANEIFQIFEVFWIAASLYNLVAMTILLHSNPYYFVAPHDRVWVLLYPHLNRGSGN